MRIREAEPKDQPALQRLYEILVPAQPVQVLPERIEEALFDPNTYLLVCDIDGQVVGTIFLFIGLDCMFGRNTMAVVDNLIVDPSKHRQGIATALFHRAEAIAKSRGSTKLFGISAGHRVESHNLYRKLGYETEGLVPLKKFLWRNPAQT